MGPRAPLPADCLSLVMPSALVQPVRRLPARAEALPTELLCSIFRRLAFRECVAVSHVCSAWRAVAVADPDLWTTLDLCMLPNPTYSCLHTLLTRSGARPVDLLCYTIPKTGALAAGLLLEENLHRLRVLELSVTRHETWEALEADVLRRTPAPILEELTIRELCSDCGGSSVMDADIFGGRAPRLARLELEGIQPPPPACLAFSLVRSFAYRRPFLLASFPSLSVFPCLEEYVLHHKHRWSRSTAPLPPGQQLRRLVFSCSKDEIRMVLRDLLPYGHFGIQDLIIDCPCTLDSAEYALRGIDGDFDCLILSSNETEGLCMRPMSMPTGTCGNSSGRCMHRWSRVCSSHARRGARGSTAPLSFSQS